MRGDTEGLLIDSSYPLLLKLQLILLILLIVITTIGHDALCLHPSILIISHCTIRDVPDMSLPNSSVSSLRILGVEEASFTYSLPNINIDSKNAAISRRVYVTLPSLDECCERLHFGESLYSPTKKIMIWDAIP